MRTALAALLLLACSTSSVAAPLNFVFVMVDDLGYADLGCYGADLHETPHIDRFAQQSVRFTDAYAAASVCSPTRAALMTGKYPARLHMTVWYESSANPPKNRALVPPITVGNLPLEEVTIAERLHEAGYLTAHVGKWHLGDAAHYPETQGFDVNVGGTFWGAPDTFFWPYRGAKTFGGGEYRYVPHTEFGRPGEYLTDRLTDEALEVLDRAGDRPFFLHLAYHTVHTPIEAKPEDIARFEAGLKPGLHHDNATYAAMVHSLDENFARVLKKLDELGLAERTVVILTSDNGGFVNAFRGRRVTNNAPLRSGKGSLYEGGVRVPLMVRWPGETPAGGVCHEPVVTMDFYPTILEMAGIAGQPQGDAAVDGLSIVPLLKDPTAKLDRQDLFWHYPHYYPTTTPVSAVRSGDWKLLEYLDDERVELYHLAKDLGEQNDRAATLPDRAKALRDKLHAWRAAVGAQMPERQQRPPLAAVSGTVTLDGQPLAGAEVFFLPQGATRPALGVTDESGAYVLTTYKAGDGAHTGTYRVVVRAGEDMNNNARSRLPTKYSDPKKSQLRVDVRPGQNEMNFDLVSD